jgi:hypothetical protein
MPSEPINLVTAQIMRLLPSSAPLLAILLEKPQQELRATLAGMEASGSVRRRTCSLTGKQLFVPILRLWAGGERTVASVSPPAPRVAKSRQYRFDRVRENA